MLDTFTETIRLLLKKIPLSEDIFDQYFSTRKEVYITRTEYFDRLIILSLLSSILSALLHTNSIFSFLGIFFAYPTISGIFFAYPYFIIFVKRGMSAGYTKRTLSIIFTVNFMIGLIILICNRFLGFFDAFYLSLAYTALSYMVLGYIVLSESKNQGFVPVDIVQDKSSGKSIFIILILIIALVLTVIGYGFTGYMVYWLSSWLVDSSAIVLYGFSYTTDIFMLVNQGVFLIFLIMIIQIIFALIRCIKTFKLLRNTYLLEKKNIK